MPKRLQVKRKLKKFCRLFQTIYRLKQLGKVGNKRFIRYLKKIGFILITTNVNILINSKKKIIISVYINNVIYAAKELQLFNKFKT